MENKSLTLGSLFDGSGGFPLGGILAGIKPVWSAEIEPFPVLVTHKRLPQVKHYGDVSGIKGSELDPVDIITFGSPCQDMSIAGRRAGLDGERSGLFYQAIRIIKEMREATNGKHPRYCVWENVPGAFSSNKGEDFRAVLEAVVSVKETGIEVPAPESDVLLGDGWSLAYRVLDAQYWGVPQRRARIYLVADFDGGSAGEILFKSEGLSGYTPQGFRSWQGTAGGAEEGAGEAGGRPDAGSGDGVTYCMNTQGNSGVGITEDKTLALVAQDHGSVLQAAGFSTEHSAQSRSIGYEEETSPTLRAGVVPAAMAIENHPTDSRVKICEDGKCQTLTERMGTGGGNVPLVAEPEPMTLKIRCGGGNGGKGALIQKDKSATLATNNDQTLFQPVEGPQGFDRYNGKVTGDVTHTLDTGSGNTVPMVFEPAGDKEKSYAISRIGFNGGEKAAFNFAVNEEVSPTLETGGPHAVAKPEIKAYGVCSKSSHSMMSDNPHSGFYEADTSRTLDQGGGNPTCNQGGICIVAPVSEEKRAVAFADKSATLSANDGPKGPSSQQLGNPTENFVAEVSDAKTFDVRFTSEGSRVVRGHVYPTDTARTLSTDKPDPAGNQGGVAVLALEPGAASRVGGHVYEDGKSGTLRANAGDNQQAVTYALQGSMIGREDKNGPQGDGVNEDVSFTLNTVDKHAVAYGLDRASFNQGKNARFGFAVEEELEPTIVAKGPGAVAHPEGVHYSTSKNSYHTNAIKEQANTLVASDYKDPPTVNVYHSNHASGMNADFSENDSLRTLAACDYKDPPTVCEEPMYIVRRLTPVECARLQGFPDWWCEGLEIPEPTDEEVSYWMEVWETWRKATNPDGKPKTEKQVRKWLASPYTDAAEYKLWGNGVALPCVYFVLSGIAWAAGKDREP